MVKLNGVISNKQGKEKPSRIVSPLIADTVRQIEDIVLSSPRACSQIDFIFCVNNSILKFYFLVAGGELLEQVGKLCLAGSGCWVLPRSITPVLLVSPGPPALDINNQTFRLDLLPLNRQGRP